MFKYIEYGVIFIISRNYHFLREVLPYYLWLCLSRLFTRSIYIWKKRSWNVFEFLHFYYQMLKLISFIHTYLPIAFIYSIFIKKKKKKKKKEKKKELWRGSDSWERRHGRYLCCRTVSPRGYHPPSSQCFHTDMVY